MLTEEVVVPLIAFFSDRENVFWVFYVFYEKVHFQVNICLLLMNIRKALCSSVPHYAVEIQFCTLIIKMWNKFPLKLDVISTLNTSHFLLSIYFILYWGIQYDNEPDCCVYMHFRGGRLSDLRKIPTSLFELVWLQKMW